MAGSSKTKTQRNRQVIALARAGWSQPEIGRKFGITKQRVSKIIKDHAPELEIVRRKAPPPPPPEPKWCYCRRRVPPGQARYCSPEHNRAMRVFRRLTVNYDAGRLRLARYYLRHPKKFGPGEKTWATRVLRSPRRAPARRYLHTSSETYQVLAEAGLVRRLPKHIRIIDDLERVA